MPSKTKLISCNRHRDPLLASVEMNGIELPEENTRGLLGLTFTEAASRKVGSLYSAQPFLTPESILYRYKSTIRQCMEYSSPIWGGASRSHGLYLLDRVQKRVVSLVGSAFFLKLNILLLRSSIQISKFSSHSSFCNFPSTLSSF